VGIEVIEEIEIRHAGSPRKVVNRENRRKNRSGIALESLINQGFPMTMEETGGNLLSAGVAVKSGGGDRSTRLSEIKCRSGDSLKSSEKPSS
jgi:hypothetical protein